MSSVVYTRQQFLTSQLLSQSEITYLSKEIAVFITWVFL